MNNAPSRSRQAVHGVAGRPEADRRTAARGFGLQRVGVLELVDQHVAVSGGERHAHLFGARQQVARVVQQVVEVEECGCALRLLESGDDLGDLRTDQRQETASGSPWTRACASRQAA